MSNLIRTAQLADLPQLKAIYNHAVAHSTATFDLYPRDDADRLAWFQAHQGKYALLVCETDGVIAGYASLSRYRERPAFDGAAEVSIYLHPDFRGQHIGSQLMQKILAFAAQQRTLTRSFLLSRAKTPSVSICTKNSALHCAASFIGAERNSAGIWISASIKFYFDLCILHKFLRVFSDNAP